MSIDAISGATVPPLFSTSSRTTDPPTDASDECRSCHPVVPDAASTSGTLQTSPSSYERALLRIASTQRLKQTESGNTSLRSQSLLKYTYELKTADGTQIRLTAKARASYSYREHGDTSTIKAKAHLQISLLTKGVQTDLAPLLDVTDSGQLSGVADALRQFREDIGGLTENFLDATALQGDELMGGIVDAFNDLTGSISSILLGEETENAVAASDQTVALPPPEPAPQLPEDSIEDAAESGSSTTPGQIEPAIADQPVQTPGSTESDAPEIAKQPKLFFQSVLATARLRFRHSLTQLIRVFEVPEPESSGPDSTHTSVVTSLRTDSHLSAYVKSRWFASAEPNAELVNTEV